MEAGAWLAARHNTLSKQSVLLRKNISNLQFNLATLKAAAVAVTPRATASSGRALPPIRQRPCQFHARQKCGWRMRGAAPKNGATHISQPRALSRSRGASSGREFQVAGVRAEEARPCGRRRREWWSAAGKGLRGEGRGARQSKRPLGLSLGTDLGGEREGGRAGGSQHSGERLVEATATRACAPGSTGCHHRQQQQEASSPCGARPRGSAPSSRARRPAGPAGSTRSTRRPAARARATRARGRCP